MNKRIVLEDGFSLVGQAIGSEEDSPIFEAVFNTSMTGYQEILSDPSYYGQGIIFTNPLIGNVGINRDDFEALDPSLFAVILSSLCPTPSNFRCKMTLGDFLKQKKVPGIANVDTRALVLHLRDKGTLRGKIVDVSSSIDDVAAEIQETPWLHDHSAKVMTKKAYEIPATGKRIVLLDFGAKLNIVHTLVDRNCAVIVVPGSSSLSDVLSYSPDGILVSNGPGDPQDNKGGIETICGLIEKDIPMFGICLGHQLIALSKGAKTYKMKFGHRGANQPVIDLKTGKVSITSQNHGYAVDADSLEGTGLLPTHLNLNDRTIEGLRDERHPVFSVQYHPEAAAGPHDSFFLIDQFLAMIDEKEGYIHA